MTNPPDEKALIETPEGQTLWEIIQHIKSLPTADQHYIEMHAINIRRMMQQDKTGMFTMAFALVGAEMAALNTNP